MKLSVFVLLASLSASLVWGADEPVAKINGRIAHPTHVIAQAKPGVVAQAQARQSATLFRITAEPPTMSGLIIMDTTPAIAAKAAQTPEELGAALAKRIAMLEATGDFAFVEPDYLIELDATPNDDAFIDGTMWGLYNYGQNGGTAGADINVVPAWEKNVGNSNIVVAVIDSGVRYTHQDLRGQMWHNKAEIPGNGIDDDNNGLVDDVVGYDFYDNDGDPNGQNGHGTHVAGTIGAMANGGGRSVGVVWNTQIMALRVGNQFLSTAAIIQAIDYAIRNGAKIINCSFGGYGSDQAMFVAFSRARTAGLLVVASAGNDANNNDVFPPFPASYDLDNIISVAAIDRNDKLADFSNFGIRSVDIGAPGVDIYSTWNGSDTDYNTISGTSMASPHTAGSAALIWSSLGNATYADVKRRLLQGVTPTQALATNVVSGGRVNVFRSMLGYVDGIFEISISPAPGTSIPVGTTYPIHVSVSDDFGVTNAVVTGTFAGLPSVISFVPGTNALTESVYTGLIPTALVPGVYTLTLKVTSPSKVTYNTNITYSLVRPPSNDSFASAEKIVPAGAVIRGDNSLATRQVGEPNHAGITATSGSLWYSWSPASSGSVIVDADGSTFDTVLAVYRGTALNTLIPVGSADNVPTGSGGTNRNPYVIFNATAATTYWIAVAGARTNELGTFRFRLEPNGVPDTIPPVVVITSPLSGKWISAADRKVVITGTASDPLPNSSGLQKVFISLNGDTAVGAAGSNDWSITLQLSTNTLNGVNTIEAFATDYAENISLATRQSKIILTYRQLSLTNDLFALGTPLTGTSGSLTTSNLGATNEFMEPKHGGNEGGHSLWYTYTPAADGILFINTDGSVIDTLLGLYTGEVVGELTTVASSDDIQGDQFSEVVTAVKAGVTYHIAVDGYAGAVGDITLNYNFTTGEVFQVNVTTNGNGSVFPRSGIFPKNATVTFTASTPATNRFIQWETPEGVQLSTSNPYSLTLTASLSLVAKFGPAIYAEDFESGGLTNLPWVASGWVVQATPATVSGGQMVYSANSGATANRATNTLSLKINTLAGSGSFDYVVNCEQFFDRLVFKVNGETTGTWTGLNTTQFGSFVFDVAEGLNTFEWQYIKDNAIAAGLDQAFIDAIKLPIAPQISVIEGDLVAMAAGNRGISIESSADLTHWTPVSGGEGITDGKGLFRSKLHPNSGTTTLFYRVRIH